MRVLIWLVAAAMLLLQTHARADALDVTIDGSRLVLTGADGTTVADDKLVGQVLALGAAGLSLRIDAVAPSESDPEVTLYTVAVQDPDGVWRNPCPVGIDGSRRLLALAGYWTADGRHVADAARFNVTCTAGAIGKCVLWGYKPWQDTSMWALHQACVRMTRADYCGDGTGYTRDGTPIDVWDSYGIQRPDRPDGLTFEAAWGPDGAVCVARTRIPEIIDGDALARQCSRLAGRIGPQCSEKTADRFGASLIRNGS